ncbi:MAG: hypothetical protein WC326_02355 [Candidatus Delongbacteria bacterium]
MDNPPRPGTAILLAVGGQTWRTELAGLEQGALQLSLGEMPPLELLRLDPGTKVSCRYHDSQALCIFDTTVRGQLHEAERHLLELEAPPQVARNQRRRHLRVSRRVPMTLRLPLRNEALGKVRGREFVMTCWVEAVAVNISAGGMRMLLHVPRQHSVAQHRDAHVRFELGGEVFRDRRLTFVRRDWSTDDVVLVYEFADLSRDEAERIEGFNLNWLHQQSQSGRPESE